MSKKVEIIRQYVKDIVEQIGEEDAVLIVAHTSKPLKCVRALKGSGINIVTSLAYAMTEDPELLTMMKMAVEFAEHQTINKKN